MTYVQTIDDAFILKVEADEVSLSEYLERLNTIGSTKLVTDPAHWEHYGITKASQLATYLDECVERERRKGNLL